MDRFIGKMLDNRYELLEVIGVGGMAVVYKAKCHRLNRFVAVKILKEEYAADEELRRQFHDESQAVAMLSHPNIVNVYDVSRSGSVEYIVMELIDGITLKDYLSRRGPLTPKEIVIFATQIAKALEHAHSRDIVHRDIKPQNIMLLRDGTVKVADFGIARLTNRQQTYCKGEAIGSVHYVSPEQAKGSHIDNRTDIYSLGVVMYEMITGRLPFEGDTPVSVALQHINSLALPPSALMDGVPPQLEEITMKAMNPVLSKRYVSATQMLEDLEEFRADLQVQIDIPSAQMKPVPDEVSEEDQASMDATRKLQNTGEVLETLLDEHRKKPKTDDLRKEGGKMAKQKKRFFGGSMLYSIVAVLVFVIGAVYFMISVINPFGKGDSDKGKLSVPQLVGTLYDDAVKTNKDFKIEIGEQIYDDKMSAGMIISQDPASGHSAKKGDKVTVTVSRGPKSTTMVDYKGQEARLVKNELDRMGIHVIESEEFSDDIEQAYVISTSPAAGSPLEAGDTVVLTVSKGKKPVPVKVPDLLGKTEADARSALTSVGLVCSQTVYIESEKAAGLVVFQTIPANSEVESGTIVDIYVSKGPAAKPQPGGGKEPEAGHEAGGGTSYDPYPDDPNKRKVSYTFSLIDEDGPISIEVQVNGKTEYLGTHYLDENDGKVTVTLTGYTGYNTITVLQNQTVTNEENLSFE